MSPHKKMKMAREYLEEFGSLSKELSTWLISRVEDLEEEVGDMSEKLYPPAERGSPGDW